MDFKSRSQAGQDLFAFLALGRQAKGVFLDIGANNPVDINNTYALEQLGWQGILVDNSEESARACLKLRKSPMLLMDVTKPMDWVRALEAFGGVVDYLSLDVDEATLQALKHLPLNKVRFRAITIEHDAYRFGEGRRDEMVAILKEHGYDILCADIQDKGLSFEIWAVDPKLVDMKLAEHFRSDFPIDWKLFFRWKDHETLEDYKFLE